VGQFESSEAENVMGESVKFQTFNKSTNFNIQEQNLFGLTLF
jgi:hypothetical protein